MFLLKLLLNIFRQFLSDDNGKDLSVSFYAAGLLVRLISYGPEVWTVTEPSREDIMEEVDKVIHTWDISEPVCSDQFR